MDISAFQAILLGVYYWMANSALGYGATWARPLFAGMMAGIIMGDIKIGCIVGAYIEPAFLTINETRGPVVWDRCASTVVCAVIVMERGIPATQAVVIAAGIVLPVAILFAQIQVIGRLWFVYPAFKADDAAAKGEDLKIIFYGSWFCWLSKFVLYCIPMTMILMFGAEPIYSLMTELPRWTLNALACAGGMLPAAGFAMALRAIGRPAFLPFFLGGFFLVQYARTSGLFLAIIGLFLAFLYYLIADASKKERAVEEKVVLLEDQCQRLLTIKDCDRMFRRWWWFCEQSSSYARMQSVAFCCAFIPALKKLYGNDPDEYSQALTRHLLFFNTQGIWGSLIPGIVLAMEEQRAMGMPITEEAIAGLKASFMGPLASLGDMVDRQTLFPLYTILVLPLAEAGSPLGAILQFTLVTGTMLVEGIIFSRMGFHLGSRAALNSLQSGGLSRIISSASVMGLFMMGGLSATMVQVITPMWIPTTNIAIPMYVQASILDKVIPGLLPLATILLTYRALMKGTSLTKMTLILLAIGLGAGTIGLLGNGGFLIKGWR